MRRLAVVVGAVVLGLLLAHDSVAANRPQPFTWFGDDGDGQPHQFGQILYQLDGNVPGAVNPTLCAWNDQDTAYIEGQGVVADSVTGEMCLIADYDDGLYPKRVSFRVTAPKDTLSVTLRNEFGASWSVASVPRRNDRVWELCVVDPVADALDVHSQSDLDRLPLVDGTNGGRGIPVRYTLEIDNVGRRDIGIVAQTQIAYAGDIGPPKQLGVPCP